MGGRRAYELMRTDAHTPHSVQFHEVHHKTAILTGAVHVQLSPTAE